MNKEFGESLLRFIDKIIDDWYHLSDGLDQYGVDTRIEVGESLKYKEHVTIGSLATYRLNLIRYVEQETKLVAVRRDDKLYLVEKTKDESK